MSEVKVKRMSREYRTTQQARDYAKAYHRRKRTKGQCVYGGCTRRAARGHTLCKACLERARERTRSLYQQRKEQGLCRQCGKGPLVTTWACAKCRTLRDPANPPEKRKAERQVELEVKRAKAAAAFQQWHAVLEERVSGLDIRTQKIIELFIGGNTLAEIGEAFGVTRERVRQILDRGLRSIGLKNPFFRGCGYKKGNIRALERVDWDRLVVMDVPEYLPSRTESETTRQLKTVLREMDSGQSVFIISNSARVLSKVRNAAESVGVVIIVRRAVYESRQGYKAWKFDRDAEPVATIDIRQ